MTNANVPGPMSFFTNPSFLQTGESVTEGHPDKLCDQISDAILDAIIARDSSARVACETLVTRGLVFVTGEITTNSYVDIQAIVRNTVREVGYTDCDYGFDANTCGVIVSLNEQSPDIKGGVDVAEEVRGEGDSDDIAYLGAGDQGSMIGFACRETEDILGTENVYMPLPIYLSHRLAEQLARVRRDGQLSYLRPDGKSQVTVEYRNGAPARIDSVTLAAQHDPEVSNDVLQRDLRQLIIREVIPHNLMDRDTKFHINASGRFVVGGPMADAGLTGRKILVDTYGGGYKHGGGAFSGKDPTKVDRSGAYMARYIAKNIVAAGLADRCEVQLSYVIGKMEPTSVSIETFGVGKITDEKIQELVTKYFDMTPGAIIEHLGLRKFHAYRQLAAYGHFGRTHVKLADGTDIEVPWERTDKADVLRQEAGLPAPEEQDG